MNQSKKYIAGFVEFDFNPGFYLIHQRLISRIICLSEDACWFAYRDQMVVKIENIGGFNLWAGQSLYPLLR